MVMAAMRVEWVLAYTKGFRSWFCGLRVEWLLPRRGKHPCEASRLNRLRKRA
jgi:hypothetical protein